MTEHTDPANTTPPSVDRVSALWLRINEHKLVQWSIGYIAFAFGIQHGVTLLVEAFDWPHAVERVSMLLLILGLPLVMTLAWYHGARATRHVSKVEMSILSLLLVIGAFLFYTFAQPGEQTPNQGAKTASVAGLSIAVLPFANLSGDASQEFFSDGITEEITAALAKVRGLTVIGRTSAFEYKGRNRDLRAIGQALGVTHLIEGSVRRAGDEVRITAQLVQANNGASLWSDSYDHELKNIFATQEEIAQAIAGALKVPLRLNDGDTLVSDRTNDLESYQDFLRAKALVRSRGGERLMEAAGLLEKAVARNPDFAPAWALLAQAYQTFPNYSPAFRGGSADDLRKLASTYLPKAEAAAKRAVQLDAKNADAYAALGTVQMLRGNRVQAEDLFEKALGLDPNNPDILHAKSIFLGEVGRFKDALPIRKKLQTIEPFVPPFNWNTARIFWLNGQEDDAIAILRRISTDDFVGSRWLAQIYTAQGHYAQAADELMRAPSGLYPPGVPESAARLLRSAPAQPASPQTIPYLGDLSWVFVPIGLLDRGLEFEQRNVEAGYQIGANFWVPYFTKLRNTPRFKLLVRQMGLVDYWKARGWPDACHPVGTDDFACN